MNADKLVNDLTTILNENPKVKALVLAGSFARQTVYKADPYSDMEVYIVAQEADIPEIEAILPEVVAKLGNVIFSYKNQWAGFSTVFDDLFRLEMPIAKFSELSSVFNRPKAQEVKILIDKTDGELQKTLDKRPETIDFGKKTPEKIPDFWYMAILGVQYLKKGELWNSMKVLGMLQGYVIRLWEFSNDPSILLLETNKRIEKFLTPNQLGQLKSVVPNYDEESIRNGWVKILEIFSEISPDHEIEKQVKPKLLEML